MKSTLVALCLAAGLFAQESQGDFVVAGPASAQSTGGLFVVNGLGGTVTSLNASGDLRNAVAVTCDPYDDTALWVGTTRASSTAAPSIYRVVAAAGKIISTTRVKLTLSSSDVAVYRVHVFGHQLLFLTATQLSLVPQGGGTPKVLLQLGGTNGTATDFVCDGRDAFLLMQPTQSILAEHVLRVDLEKVSSVKEVYRSGGITYFVTGASLDGAGNLILAEYEAFSAAGNLKLVDRDGKLLRTFKLPFTYGTASVCADHGGTTIVVGGKSYDQTNSRVLTGFITLLNWQVFKTEFGTGPERYGQLDVRRPVPLDRYGHVCQGKTGWRPEIGASGGLPSRGNASYALELTAQPSRLVLLLLGAHGGMPVPLPLAVMGAGTCELGVQPLVQVFLQTDGAGRIQLKAPIPQSAPPAAIDVQWLVAAPGDNNAGFLATQVGSAVIR